MIIELVSMQESDHSRVFMFALTDTGCDLDNLTAEVQITGKEARVELQTELGSTVFSDNVLIINERSVADIVTSCVDKYRSQFASCE